jgi:hypothetical protein
MQSMLAHPGISEAPTPIVNAGRRYSALRQRLTNQFFHSLSSCKFPDTPLKPYTPANTLPSHIVLIADPHVPHPVLSHPEDAWAWTNKLRQAFDELFMRKSWNVVMRLGRVDAVVVVGDMMDVGRGRMGDEE